MVINQTVPAHVKITRLYYKIYSIYFFEADMLLRSFRIPLWFFIAGVFWAIFNNPLISLLAHDLDASARDLIRGISDFISVAVVTAMLYFTLKGQNKKLSASEEQYRRLFELNPNPMWVYNIASLSFVKVNEAAIETYGYSRDEFMAMTIMDIRPEEDREKLAVCLEQLAKGVNKSGNWRHVKKGGELLHASIVTYDLVFNGEACRLVMATNITGLILKEEKIKAQNTALHEIAWSNSHEIRRALCSVMSLTALLQDAIDEKERKEYLQLLKQCTQDFDEILQKNNKTVDLLKDN